MAYRVEYGPAIPTKYQKKPVSHRIRSMTAAFLLGFVFLVSQFFPAGTAVLRHYILPAAPTVTEAALRDLMSDIREGVSLNDAFTAFCVQIISHDKAFSN